MRIHRKRNKEIKGVLILPIEIGSAAFIREESGELRRTGTVERLLRASSSVVKFETKNTIYRLRIQPPTFMIGHVEVS